jgi:hypothetical protein
MLQNGRHMRVRNGIVLQTFLESLQQRGVIKKINVKAQVQIFDKRFKVLLCGFFERVYV